jgi:hypothetical protein
MVRACCGMPAAVLLGVLAAHALALVPHAAAETAEETILAESDFLWDVDGWTTRGAAENFQHGQKMIKAADTGPDMWYFVAPGKFLGAKRAAYGGKLSFRHGFFEYNRCLSSAPRVARSCGLPRVASQPMARLCRAHPSPARSCVFALRILA